MCLLCMSSQRMKDSECKKFCFPYMWPGSIGDPQEKADFTSQKLSYLRKPVRQGDWRILEWDLNSKTQPYSLSLSCMVSCNTEACWGMDGQMRALQMVQLVHLLQLRYF